MFSKLRKQRRLRAFGGTQVSAPHVSHSYDCKSEISVCQLPSTYSHPESYGLTFSSTRHPLLCIRTEYRTDRRPGHREARWKKAQVGAWRPNLFLSLVNTCWNEELLFKWKTLKEPISTSSWISCTGAVALGVQDLTPCMESLNTYERWCGSCCQQWAYGLPGSGWIPSLLRERDPGKHPELARPVISMHFFSLSLRSDLEPKKGRQVILILCTNTSIFTESSYYAVVSNQKEEGEQKGYLISFPPWRRERVAQNNREEKIRLFWAEKCKTKG